MKIYTDNHLQNATVFDKKHNIYNNPHLISHSTPIINQRIEKTLHWIFFLP